MARIRSIKPEFWTSEQIVECSPIARLLFIGMWNFCDDAGNHPASFKTLKMEVFPGDNISIDEIEAFTNELIKNRLIVTYTGEDGREYWHVTGWQHQKIDRPTLKHPHFNPQKTKKFDEHSSSTRRQVDEASPPEGSRREGSLKEGNKVLTHTDYPSQQNSLPSPAACVCIELKKIGIIDLNPAHPELIGLLNAGATLDEFIYAARTAKGKGKGFSYVLGTVKGQRTDAKKTEGQVLRGAKKNKADELLQRNRDAVKDWIPPEMRARK